MSEQSKSPLTDAMLKKPYFSPSEWIEFTQSVEWHLTEEVAENAALTAENARLKAEVEAAREDSARIDELEKILTLTGNPLIAFNDDPDIDCEDSPTGMMPVGFRIVFDGCQGVSMFVGDSLRAALDAERGQPIASHPSSPASDAPLAPPSPVMPDCRDNGPAA